jgi:type II secretory pathway pseudopilin PulG
LTTVRHSRRQSKAAFTLIEALVVVSVIATLLGLMLPSLRGARESGRMSVCASNVRQLAIANELYSGDARGRYAPGAAAFISNLARWHGSRDTLSQAFHPRGGALIPYLDDSSSEDGAAAPGVRGCPSFAPTLEVLAAAGAGFERGCGGYGYNNTYVGVVRRRGPGGAWIMVSDLTGAPACMFTNPARTVGFADGALAADPAMSPQTGGMIEYSFAEARYWPDAPASRADPSVHFRHGTPRSPLACVAWLDGHVSAEALHDTWTSGLYGSDPRDFNIGWFGNPGDNRDFDYR